MRTQAQIRADKNYYRRNTAKVCARRRKYYLEHKEEISIWAKQYKKIIRDALAKLKTERGCCDCGYKEHPVALSFDHVRGEKEFHVADGHSLEAALREAEKCEIRCANCHQIKTAKEREVGTFDA